MRSGRSFIALTALLAGLLMAGPLKAADWAELPRAEQQALEPLREAWPGIGEPQRARWRALAARWSALPAAEQWRLQARMREWARLTPAQRAAARLQFQETSRLPADDRHLAWQAYQSLSEDERRELATQARRASPVQPVPQAARDRSRNKDNWVNAPALTRPQAASPSARQAQPGASTTPMTRPALPPAQIQHGMPKIATTPGFVDRTTLLPQRGPQGAAAAPASIAALAARPASAAASSAEPTAAEPEPVRP